MATRLVEPRPISNYEAQIIRRVLEVGAEERVSAAMLDSINRLIVHEEGGGAFDDDSLDLAPSRAGSRIAARALGMMANDVWIELLLWARDCRIIALELQPFEDDARPTRLPILESIQACPQSEPRWEEDALPWTSAECAGFSSVC